MKVKVKNSKKTTICSEKMLRKVVAQQVKKFAKNRTIFKPEDVRKENNKYYNTDKFDEETFNRAVGYAYHRFLERNGYKRNPIGKREDRNYVYSPKNIKNVESNKILKPKSRSRYRIKTKTMRNIASPSEKVYLYGEKGDLYISKSADQNSSILKTYIVEYDGSLRISSLERYGCKQPKLKKYNKRIKIYE